MPLVTVTKKNEVHLLIDTEPGIMQEISDHFTFEVPGAKFTPQFRHKLWDGKIRLASLFTRTLYVGLLDHLKAFCALNEYPVQDQTGVRGDPVKEEEIEGFVNALTVCGGDQTPITPRDYQVDAVKHAVLNGRTVLLSPTSSGKSLIIYFLVRWHVARGRRVLIIVPTTSLVEQMYKDFCDYAYEDEWSVTQNCTRIYSGKEKTNEFQVVISTWQSIYKMPKAWFDGFHVAVGDEAHNFKAKSLTSILEKCVNTRFRIGTTGTLDGTKTHRLVLEGLFGPVYQVTTTKKLMDENSIAQLKITCLLLAYADEERKMMKKADYAAEMDFLVTHPKRNRFIRNLVVSRKGNTLVLFQYVEKHGRVLFEMIRDRVAEGRKVFFVHGGTDTGDREEIRRITEQEQDAIIVASLGTFSTGINIRRLHNIVVASPSKSRIRVLQSIGRGLRKGEEKEVCHLFDIGDDLSWKSHKNFTLKHMVERVKMFNEEGFTYKWIQVPLHAESSL